MSADATAANEQPLSVTAHLAKLQHHAVVLRSQLHLLNCAHRRARAALRRQAEADQALRTRLLDIERLALVGNMAALAATVIGLADDLRRPKKARLTSPFGPDPGLTRGDGVLVEGGLS